MQNSMVMFTFFGFDWKYLFLCKFGPNNQNSLFKLKVGSHCNSNMHNSTVMFHFFGLKQKYPFWVTLVQKPKIVSLS